MWVCELNGGASHGYNYTLATNWSHWPELWSSKWEDPNFYTCKSEVASIKTFQAQKRPCSSLAEHWNWQYWAQTRLATRLEIDDRRISGRARGIKEGCYVNVVDAYRFIDLKFKNSQGYTPFSRVGKKERPIFPNKVFSQVKDLERGIVSR